MVIWLYHCQFKITHKPRVKAQAINQNGWQVTLIHWLVISALNQFSVNFVISHKTQQQLSLSETNVCWSFFTTAVCHSYVQPTNSAYTGHMTAVNQ